MNVKLLDLQPQYAALRDEIHQAIDAVCDAQSFTLGPVVERFEKNLASYCGTRYAIGVSSGTDALLCAMMAIGIKAEDEVICPTFTFFATAGSIARLGAKPVFVDIDPHTFNLDPSHLSKLIRPRTRAIIPVHLFGQMADMEAINQIADHHNLVVLEDAAQAIGAMRNGRPACSMGFAGALSFYPTKNLGAFGDGGAICCNDDTFAETCRLLRVHGSGHQYHHKLIGGMFRLDALQAAILDVKLPHLPEWNDARRRNAALYDELLKGSAVEIPVIAPGNQSIYNQYCVRVPNRDRVKQVLADKGVGSAVYYPMALHMQECFKYLGHRAGEFPNSERACQEILALPVYPELPEAQIRYVAQALLEAVAG